MSDSASVVFFSLRMAALSTLLILPFGVALGYALARGRWRGKALVETLVAMPLVVPPVATGVLLLHLFGRRGPIGQLLDKYGVDVVFTWRAVVIAMAVMSAPLLIRAARLSFEEVDARLEEIAGTLGASRWRVFYAVSLPLAMRGVIAGSLLAFARALGEFGATVMIAGNIPGRTATLSLSIYNLIELGKDAEAMRLVVASLALAFGAVIVAEIIQRRAVTR